MGVRRRPAYQADSEATHCTGKLAARTGGHRDWRHCASAAMDHDHDHRVARTQLSFMNTGSNTGSLVSLSLCLLLPISLPLSHRHDRFLLEKRRSKWFMKHGLYFDLSTV